MVELLEMTDRPATVGFQADMAHTLLYTMGYNAPEDAILPRTTTGKISRSSTKPSRNSPTNYAPGPSTSTSPRTTAPFTVLAPTTRPADTVSPPTPPASSTFPATRATGFATKRGPAQALPPHLLGRLHVPQRSHDEAQDLERHPRRHGRGARTTRLASGLIPSPSPGLVSQRLLKPPGSERPHQQLRTFPTRLARLQLHLTVLTPLSLVSTLRPLVVWEPHRHGHGHGHQQSVRPRRGPLVHPAISQQGRRRQGRRLDHGRRSEPSPICSPTSSS